MVPKMENTFDVIIAGLGAMGSSSALHLAKNNKKVLGFDQFQPPHTLGSSHGQSRVIREAYYEHPLYVPIVQRAYELWFELEKASGLELFLQTGGLMIGSAESELYCGAKTSAEMHKLEHKLLTNEELKTRFPAFKLPDNILAVWEPRAGVLFPERCIEAHLKEAEKYGANLNYNEKILEWVADDAGVKVATDKGEYTANQLVFTSGAWINNLVPELKMPLEVERQVLFWFDPAKKTDAFNPDKFPVYICEAEPGIMFYGFPDLGDGVKIANHHRGGITTPENLDRQVSDSEIEGISNIIREYS